MSFGFIPLAAGGGGGQYFSKNRTPSKVFESQFSVLIPLTSICLNMKVCQL